MPWRKGNRLQIVQENEASVQVSEVYRDVKATLGISYVPLAFQALAAYPEFLRVQWQAIRPALLTEEFWQGAARLQAEAYTYVHNYLNVPSLAQGGSAPKAAETLDLLCDVEGFMLLMLTLQVQALEMPVGQPGTTRPLKQEHNPVSPAFVDIEATPPALRKQLEEMRLSLELPYFTDVQRALAHWPELFTSTWRALKPAIQSVIHERALTELRESAWVLTQRIPVPVDLEYSRLLEMGVTEDDVATVTRLTDELLRGSALSLIEASFAKIGLEDDEADTEERVA